MAARDRQRLRRSDPAYHNEPRERLYGHRAGLRGRPLRSYETACEAYDVMLSLIPAP